MGGHDALGSLVCMDAKAPAVVVATAGDKMARVFDIQGGE
jgi:hypothetical protein